MLPEWFEKAVELYKENNSYLSIGRIIEVNRKQVGYYLKNNGYPPKTTFPQKNGTNRSSVVWRKYELDELFFENIDTEEKAYWFGFMCADGYVSEKKSTMEVTLQERDIYHLEKFKNSLRSNYKLTRHKKVLNGKEFIGYRLTFSSEKMKKDLVDKGCTIRKSLTLKFPTSDVVPKELVRHFIRGYFDADGCIYKNSNRNISYTVELTGTIEFLERYVKEIKLHKNKLHHPHEDRIGVNFYKSSYAGQYALHILKYMYDGATVFLDRKYELAKMAVAVLSQKTTEGSRLLEGELSREGVKS